ncbi:hypothetical protein MC885_006419 [Smutsia gigantea]|nr:hypothetical protein MC885_006419 [Smutsia gigantea]
MVFRSISKLIRQNFWFKDKKGAKQQKFIKAVTHQVKFGQQNPRQVAQSEAEKKLKKDDKKKELQELNELFKLVVAAQKISKGAGPKSVVCAFFKQGQCTKGGKCKFSHDLILERKCEKRSVYIDARDEELEKGPNVTKITLESFLAWKKRKRQGKIDKLEQDTERRKADFKAGKTLVISGREVFEFHPELVDDEEEEADDICYTQGTGDDEVDDSVSMNDIDLSLYIPRDVDETSITVASLERFSTYTSEKDENKLSEASGGRAENGERSDLEEDNKGEEQENGAIDAVPTNTAHPGNKQ